MFTMTAQRWCARFLSLAYYLLFIPFLFDLFTYGVRWYTTILFPLLILSVAGLHISFKKNDQWVSAWFWMNTVFLTVVTVLTHTSTEFANLFDIARDERRFLYASLTVAALVLPLHFIIKAKPMKPLDQEEDIEAGLPPIPTQKNTNTKTASM